MVVIASAVLAVGLYFIPIITLLYLLCGIADVLRNGGRNAGLFSRNFLGNSPFTWLLSPFNLLIDLVSYRNRGVWQLEQFPEEYRREAAAG